MGLEVKVDIGRMIEDGKYKALKEILQYLEPADIVDLMEDLDPSKKIVIFRLLPKELAAQVFSEMEIEDQKKLISLFKEERLKSILEELDPDDRTILFEELPANVVRKLLLYLPADERKKALELLNYPPDSAGRLMTPEFVDLYIDMTVKEAMERIKRIAPEKETIYTCYVIDKTRKLLGVVELKDLILADENTKIGDLMNERVVFVRTTDDQEKVVQLMKKYDLIAIPVVDSEDRLVGIVTIDDVLDVMEEETDEDIQRMFAVQRVEAPYLRTNIRTLIFKRIWWLIGLMFLEAISGSVIKRYEALIQSSVALSFFLPTMVGTGGNAGSQVSSLIIRGIATGEITLSDTFKIVLRESFIGIVLGVTLGFALYFRAYLLVRDTAIGIAVSFALAIVVFYANFLGAILPLIAKKINLDPAMMAGPFMTTLVDISGIIIYFLTTTKILQILR